MTRVRWTPKKRPGPRPKPYRRGRGRIVYRHDLMEPGDEIVIRNGRVAATLVHRWNTREFAKTFEWFRDARGEAWIRRVE